MGLKKLQSDSIIKFFTKRNNLIMVIILIIGVILMTSVSGEKEEKEVYSSIDTEAQEERLSDILSDIEGVGEVKVMITYCGGMERSLAYDVKSDNDGKSQQEDKKTVMSGGSPVVIQEIYPRVKGVIVVAQGAGDIGVKRAITEAVSAAMGVGVSNVKVYNSSNGTDR